jgi:hypothetical protein
MIYPKDPLTQEGLKELLLIMLDNPSTAPTTKGDFLLGVVALKLFDLESRLGGIEDRMSEVVGRLGTIGGENGNS